MKMINIKSLMNTIKYDPSLNMLPSWWALYSDYLALYKGSPFHTVRLGMSTEETRKMNVSRIGKIACDYLASICVGEDFAITCDSDREDKVLQEILGSNGFNEKIQSFLSKVFGLGGGIIKIRNGLNHLGQPKLFLDFVNAKNFVPSEWDVDTVIAGDFLTYRTVETASGATKEYVKVESHSWDLRVSLETGETIPHYLIITQCFEISGGIKGAQRDGQMAPIDNVEAFNIFGEFEPEITLTGLTQPLFTYIKPAVTNTIDIDSPIGTPIYSSAMFGIKTVDTIFDSLLREFRLGKTIQYVPETFASVSTSTLDVKNAQGKKTGTVTERNFNGFEKNEGVCIIGGNANNGHKVENYSPPLRAVEHKEGLSQALAMFSMQVGLSPTTFTIDATGGIQTATQVISQKSETYKTKVAHEKLLIEYFKTMVVSIFEAAKIIGLVPVIAPTPERDKIKVHFNDSIITDDEAEKERDIQLINNGILPKYMYFVRNEGMTEEEAKEIIAAQLEEAKQSQDLMFDGQDDQAPLDPDVDLPEEE